MALRYPIPAAVLCAAAQFLVTVAILKAGLAWLPRQSFGQVKLVAFASTVVVPVLLATVLGLWRRVGLQISGVRPHPVFLVSLLTAAIFLVFGIRAPEQGGGPLVQVATQLVNAFGEELLFRGVIFALLLSQPKGRAIVINGLLFGSMHLIHGFMGSSWQDALAQATVTSVAGMMFTAVRYGSGSLWLTIALHMLLNLAMIFSNVPHTLGHDGAFVFERIANLIELGVVLWVVGLAPSLRNIDRGRTR